MRASEDKISIIQQSGETLGWEKTPAKTPAKREVRAERLIPVAGEGWQGKQLSRRPSRDGGGKRGAALLYHRLTLCPPVFPPHARTGPHCCRAGWTKSQTVKMTCLAATSLIKADSFQRRTVSNQGDCHQTRKNKR